MQKKNDIKSTAGRANPFSVPDGYFETFSGRLQKRLHREEAGLSLRERFSLVLRPQLALVAAIAGFVIIGYLGFHTFTSRDQGIASEEIAEYIDLYQNEFSDYYFLSMLDDDFYPDEDIYFDDYLYPADPDTYMDFLYQDEIAIELIIREF
jgi:hypothetical protein